MQKSLIRCFYQASEKFKSEEMYKYRRLNIESRYGALC